MQTKPNFCLAALILFLCLTSDAVAQSGNKEITVMPTPNVNPTPEAVQKKPDNLEKVRFLITDNLVKFDQELNALGKLGYRLDKAFNFGGDAVDKQSFGAVLKLDEANTYEYGWMTNPNKDLLEGRLNYFAANGFYLVHTFGLTGCPNPESFTSTPNDPDEKETNEAIAVFLMGKSDVFLLARKNGVQKKVRDYKVIIGKVGSGNKPTAVIQNALNEVPHEYRPTRILFNRAGIVDLSISVLLEDDLETESKVNNEYRFIKEMTGFEKEVNTLAQSGFRFLTGRRVGMVKLALMQKTSDEAAAYTFIDQFKYEKSIAKTYKAGDVFQSTFSGDTDCDSTTIVGAKLVFERKSVADSVNAQYKYVRLTVKDAVAPTDAALAETKKFLAEGYNLKDVFYSDGVVLIFSR